MSILAHDLDMPAIHSPAPAAPERITRAEFHRRLLMQEVPNRHMAYVCPVCGTVQSIESLIRAGAATSEAAATRIVGFSCVGRFLGAGPYQPSPGGAADDPCRGCDWTLGGFLHLHRLVVVTPDGVEHPRFEVASPEQAQALRAAHAPPLVVPEEDVAPEEIMAVIGGNWVQL